MISLAITTYNRYEMTIQSFAQVIDDPRISDIVILDDASTDGSYEKLRDYFVGNQKVRVIRQAENRGMMENKKDAIGLMNYSWGIILDSDNTFGVDYLDALFKEPFFITNCIYCPEWARPNFDYRAFSNITITRKNVNDFLPKPMFEQNLNTGNYFVHRDTYLKFYEYNKDIKETETLYFAYNWLKHGNAFKIVNGMQYDHLVHSNSGWLKNASYNIKKGEEIKQLIRDL